MTDTQLDDLHAALASARREAGLLRGERDLARELAAEAVRQRDSARRWAVALEQEAALVPGLHAERDEALAAVRKLAADTARTSLTVCGDRNRLAAVLGEVLAHFVHHGHPGEPCLSSGWVAERTVARWRAALNASSQAASGPQDAVRRSGDPEGAEIPERPSDARTEARNYS